MRIIVRGTILRKFRLLHMDIGRAIKEIRKKKGLSQEQLANDSNLSRKYLYTLESDNSNPTIKVLEKVAVTLDVTISEIIVLAEKY